MSTFGLLLVAIQERLDRIEDALGIEGMTPAQAELDALVGSEGDG